MKSTIHIFGHADPFDPKSIRQYIKIRIFGDGYNCRYRHNLKRDDAKIIVLSHAGNAYGHFEITCWEEPTDEDTDEWPKTKRVYIVSKSHSYEKPVNLRDLGITQIQYGKSIDADMLQELQKRAGKVTSRQPPTA